jgi:two-component system CheB/CheR fusion protein
MADDPGPTSEVLTEGPAQTPPHHLKSSGPVRVLLVEDDEDDFVLTRDLLAEIPGGYQLEWVSSYDDALRALARNDVDVYLVDYRLGRRTGLDLLREAQARGCRVPAIMLTGLGERAVDVEAMQAGAADYLVKGQLDCALLERSIRYALASRQHEEALRKSHEELERRVRERTAELARANEALRQADRRKDEFLSILSHELRNPLAALHNALNLVCPPRGGEAAPPTAAPHHLTTRDLERAWEIIARQLKHLVRLVDDLLDVSRINQGKVQLQLQHLDLCRCVRDAVEISRPFLESRRHQLELHLPEGPLTVEGDPTRLVQVIANLLNNAAKYTEEGGHVTLTVECVGDTAVLRCKDTGAGIPAEKLPHIFDLFMQVDRTLARAQGGLGIGLTLVRRLVQMHGGSVEAHSEGSGKGSEFVVRLPLARGSGAWREKRAAPSARAPRQPHAPSRRVLVVDDDRDAADSLALLLGVRGHQVQTAHDGVAALEAARAFGPEVVLLDIGLPRLDGYQVARLLRQEPQTQGALLVALTGYGQEQDRRRSLAAGFDIHLVKPFDPDELEEILASR